MSAHVGPQVGAGSCRRFSTVQGSRYLTSELEKIGALQTHASDEEHSL